MTEQLYTVRAPWPTTAAGDAVTDEVGVEAVLDSIADYGDADVLNEVTEMLDGETIGAAGYRLLQGNAALQAQVAHLPDGRERYEAAGMPHARALLRATVLRVAEAIREGRVQLTFDGTRWHVLAAQVSTEEEALSTDMVDVGALRDSEFGQSPVDGDRFEDTAALAAAVAVSDAFCDAAVAGLAASGVSGSVLEAATAALEARRVDVIGTAQLIRATMTAATPGSARRSIVPRF